MMESLRTLFALLLVVVLVGPIESLTYANVGPGTTPNITDILLGRCQEYRECLRGEPCLPNYRNLKCESIVNSFMSGIQNVDPCATPPDVYETFLDMAPPQTMRGKTTFWSGVAGANIPQDVAQVTSQHTVLEETLPGYMAGNLTWCGSTDDSSSMGLNFTACPTWRSSTCPNNTKAAFWDSASKRLATQAEGQVFVVLNAQRDGGAFNNNSVFARIEAPNLNVAKVTNIMIYLIPDFTLPIPNNQYRETCLNGSVLALRKQLTSMNFNHTCEEDPTTFMWLQCARYPSSPYCGPYSGGSLLKPLHMAFLVLQVTLVALLSGWKTF
ncbi:ADP-ribosyl cyclase/cyclic ADP-ribose hydrolase 1-like [Diadema antillarum]|uniref:ADP-ribosyl cyclase/cyclic ADP-ribose hydrolase 1-like n=1 Tax=Diadema antillarum TaxID=105358 RepID=UPI003A8BBCD4